MTRSIPGTAASSILCVLFFAALAGCGGSSSARTDGAVLAGGSNVGSGRRGEQRRSHWGWHGWHEVNRWHNGNWRAFPAQAAPRKLAAPRPRSGDAGAETCGGGTVAGPDSERCEGAGGVCVQFPDPACCTFAPGFTPDDPGCPHAPWAIRCCLCYSDVQDANWCCSPCRSWLCVPGVHRRVRSEVLAGASAVRPLLVRAAVALVGKVTGICDAVPGGTTGSAGATGTLEEARAPRAVKEEARRPPAKGPLAAPEARMEEVRLGPPGLDQFHWKHGRQLGHGWKQMHNGPKHLWRQTMTAPSAITDHPYCRQQTATALCAAFLWPRPQRDDCQAAYVQFLWPWLELAGRSQLPSSWLSSFPSSLRLLVCASSSSHPAAFREAVHRKHAATGRPKQRDHQEWR